MELNTGLYGAFLLASALLILSPGPTVMLVTSISLRRGTRAGLTAVAGSTLAACVQLTVVVGGFASLIALAGSWFEWIRWAGVVYLIYLGVAAWSERSEPVRKVGATRKLDASRFVQGFAVMLTNPKTLLFHGAFLPQFVDPSLPELPQMLVLAGSFVLIAWLGDSIWVIAAARLGAVFRGQRARRLIDRLSGTILLAAGIALATVKRSQ